MNASCAFQVLYCWLLPQFINQVMFFLQSSVSAWIFYLLKGSHALISHIVSKSISSFFSLGSHINVQLLQLHKITVVKLLFYSV